MFSLLPSSVELLRLCLMFVYLSMICLNLFSEMKTEVHAWKNPFFTHIK